MKFSKLLLIALSISLFVSCSNDDDDKTPKGAYDNGFFILNEGSQSLGTISFSSNDLSTFTKDVYKTENGTDAVGGYLQNIFFSGDRAYIIAGGSNVINVVNRYTFKLIAKIDSDLVAPRYGVVKDGKAYVINANTYSYQNPTSGNTDDYIAVINLSTNTVESKVALNSTANRVIEENGKLYITDGYNDKMLIYNIATKTLETPVTIGYDGDSIEEEDGVIFILRKPYQGAGEIVKVKISDKSVSRIALPASIGEAGFLDIEDNKVYYTASNAIYTISPSATTAATSPLFTSAASYVYGFTVKDNRIYIADAKFGADSKAFIYNLSGALQIELTTGAGSNGFYFND
ncbi:hypothetical protein K6T82_23315 [Flavobacterium sp. 17A]|uniref:Uncharacterized protein n=1 Tax=Flavobacterium potami TaxID=2872310 RepID=A0A9X1HE83_9FLAO|nr:hypothetical protein [Flavobacterium potami]MBZ4037709.1 hypothetical protein [Flavobacterium potami]